MQAINGTRATPVEYVAKITTSMTLQQHIRNYKNKNNTTLVNSMSSKCVELNQISKKSHHHINRRNLST